MEKKSKILKFVSRYSGVLGVILLIAFVYGAKVFHSSSELKRLEHDAKKIAELHKKKSLLAQRIFDDNAKLNILLELDKTTWSRIEVNKNLWKIKAQFLTSGDLDGKNCEMQADISNYLIGDWSNSQNPQDAEQWRLNRKRTFNLMQILCMQSLYSEDFLKTERIESAFYKNEISALEVANFLISVFINQQKSKKLLSNPVGEFEVLQISEAEISSIEQDLKNPNIVMQDFHFTEGFKSKIGEKLRMITNQ